MNDAHWEICCRSNAESHFDDPITANILIAEEINNDTKDRMRWILLTSESVETFKNCRTVIRFYELRWRIEEFHKAWKTGAGVEHLRLLCAGNVCATSGNQTDVCSGKVITDQRSPDVA